MDGTKILVDSSYSPSTDDDSSLEDRELLVFSTSK